MKLFLKIVGIILISSSSFSAYLGVQATSFDLKRNITTDGLESKAKITTISLKDNGKVLGIRAKKNEKEVFCNLVTGSVEANISLMNLLLKNENVYLICDHEEYGHPYDYVYDYHIQLTEDLIN